MAPCSGIVQNMIDANSVVSLIETDNFCMLLTQYFSWSAPSNVETPQTVYNRDIF